MIFLVLWIGLSFIPAIIASGKGRSGFGFFLLSLALSPLIGGICALIAAPNTKVVEARQIATDGMRKCPFCAELVKAEAIVCKHCGKDLPALVVTTTPIPEPVPLPADWTPPRADLKTWLVLIVFVAATAVAGWYVQNGSKLPSRPTSNSSTDAPRDYQSELLRANSRDRDVLLDQLITRAGESCDVTSSQQDGPRAWRATCYRGGAVVVDIGLSDVRVQRVR